MRTGTSPVTFGLRKAPWSAVPDPKFAHFLAKSKNFGCVVCQTRPFAADQGDMARKSPAVEPVDHIGESRRGFRQVGRVYLGNIPQADQLGTGARAGHQRLHRSEER